MKISVGFLIFILSLCSVRAFAFPELVRHGYSNCVTCHISPTGGGVLSEYGRALAKELVSTWGFEGEEKFLYLVGTNQTLALGGDVRWIRVTDKSEGETESREIWMQRDLEAALTYKSFTLDATVGVETDRATEEDEFVSRRHFLMYKHTPTLGLRVGKFYPDFGIYVPDHASSIRRGLGWDQGMETYNVEGSWVSEQWSTFVTAILGRPDDPDLNREKGLSTTVSYSPTMGYKLGASYYYGETEEVIHHYIGPHAILGFTEYFFLLAQMTATRTFPYTEDEAYWGLVDYLRLNYEVIQGLHFYIAQEMTQANLESGQTRRDIFTLASQFFPRPHWEFQLQLQKLYSQGQFDEGTDRWNLYVHYYF